MAAELMLPYDLLVFAAGDHHNDLALSREAAPLFKDGSDAELVAVINRHVPAVLGYITERFTIAAGAQPCRPTLHGSIDLRKRDQDTYAVVDLDYRCPEAEAHTVASRLFPDDEGYIEGAKAIVTYDLDLRRGSEALDGERPSFSTQSSAAARLVNFARLGAEHLLFGLDHLLFLAALIIGSRRLREVVLVATSFTLAHSVTFILAALGLVQVRAAIVEPLIALSISAVAGWFLWRLWRHGERVLEIETSADGAWSLDRAGWLRLAIVFGFGLVHGLGFAGALGIDAAWSWSLLAGLLLFNVGIEVAQIAIVVVSTLVLGMIRRTDDVLHRWIATGVSGGVAAIGMVWFVQRLAAG